MMRFKRYILLMVAAVAATGCLRDPNFTGPEDQTRATGDEIEVTMSAEVPSDGPALTRVLTSTQENKIETIDVLVFDNATKTFMYSTHASDIVNTSGNAWRFKTMLRATSVGGLSGDYIGKSVVAFFLANYRNEWNAIKTTVNSGDSDTEVLAKLQYTLSGQWEDGRLLPMSAKSAATSMTAAIKGSDFGSVAFVRSVAAMDIGFNYNAQGEPQGAGNFKLNQVVVSRQNNKGYATPYSSLSVLDDLRFPSGMTSAEVTYELEETSNMGLFKHIYFPVINSQTAPVMYILLGGFYTDENESENTTTETWYKVPITTAALGNKSYLMRNYRYTIKVNSIGGPGYETKALAAASNDESDPEGNAWINANVVPWEIGKVNSDVDAHYFLDVSAKEIYLPDEGVEREDGENIINVMTDYSGGWKVEEIHYEDAGGSWESFWLSTLDIEGPAFIEGTIRLVAKSNPSSENRIAYLYVSAGRWRQKVTVVQGDIGSLEVYPEKFNFNYDAQLYKGEYNKLSVGSDRTWYVKSILNENGLPANWISLSAANSIGVPTQFGDGVYEVYVQTKMNTAGASRKGFIHVTNGRETKIVEVKQDVFPVSINCGFGGTPKYRTIGRKSYPTHIYGGNFRVRLDMWYMAVKNSGKYSEAELQQMEADMDFSLYPDQWIYRCWMLENSQEYIADNSTYIYAKQHPDNTLGEERGYYYNISQARMTGNACPTGWRLPTEIEWRNIPWNPQGTGFLLDAIFEEFNPTEGIPSNFADPALYTDAELGMTLWRESGHTYAGGASQPLVGNVTWSNWDTNGSWWTTSIKGGSNYYVPAAAREMPYMSIGLTHEYSTIKPGVAHTVRCVEDINYSF